MRRRLLLSAAFRYPQLYGQRGLAESTYSRDAPFSPHVRFRAVQRRSWGSASHPSQVCSPRRAAFSRFRDAGPACRLIDLSLPQPFSSGDPSLTRFAVASEMFDRRAAMFEDLTDRDFRASLPSRVRHDHRPQAGHRSILPWAFVLLQGFGTRALP